ncbi:RagB/SusD family nutrient uptake outer membrane protein [Mucilaginibacter phyllosphaerae]|uniref:RagB/SusD family nutrient uptake outer membrane protein n=1 Tax=Mucilaginibacter phyllosphaerae TaxID=1812349 RepID=A0A4Y8AAY9_9SPHI|nr:RagB/SusD family nutrient uptake outer membrane protein [Mucilaginibacter phyllosphaerae]MBB3969508.1 tetratricopeptide (TPR) repeat protein [Mucilaginibacter phyllosphaerae]TEW65717.1 RagB/SusD family nutrient uptake outer membrane protein [Mucilaginibacter phyllosphaerae]GGH09046.1 starch-binding protein [Mucilaginibacter phyllosphaerae]
MKAKYQLLYVAVILLLFTSCKKFLDQMPISTPTDQTTWQTEGDANAGVAASYSLLRSAFNASLAYYSYGDLASGEFLTAEDPSFSNVLNVRWGTAVQSSFTYDPLLKLRIYTPFYTAVAQSNRCLNKINNMPLSVFTGDNTVSQTAAKNKYLGEAYYTRAFAYFIMCRVWGDVPLVLENTEATVNQQYGRTAQAVVLKQAIDDLSKATQYLNLKDNSSPDRAVRADKGAAYALLAHIYAWMGDYDNCSLACDKVINSGSYSLTNAANFMDIYKGQSQESIFEIAQNNITESIDANNAYTLAGATLTTPYIKRTVPAWVLDGSKVTALYTDTNDVRLKKGFVKISSGTTSFYECIKYANIVNVNGNPNYQASLNNIVIFRLADIQLLKAEALCAKSSAEYSSALSIVNNLRLYRGAAPITGVSGADVLQVVNDERGRELFLEGHRFYDLVRLERVNHLQQFDNISSAEFAAGKYYWPLDPTLFINNSQLTQTPFWVGKVFN